MRVYRFHDVHRHQAVPRRDVECGLDFAIQCNEIEAVEFVLVAAVLCLLRQIGVVMAQINARDRTHRARVRHRTRQPMRRHAYPHAALHDGQQRTAMKGKRSGCGHSGFSVITK